MPERCAENVAVVCDDSLDVRTPVVRLLMASGFDVPAVTDVFSDVAALVREYRACVAVVALPLTGLTGLRAVRALREAVPDCDVVLVSQSGSLEVAAVEAGARALVPEHDLRVLRQVLLDIAGGRPVPGRLPGGRAQADGAPSGRVSTKPSA